MRFGDRRVRFPQVRLKPFRKNTRKFGAKRQFCGVIRERYARTWMNRGRAPRMDSRGALGQPGDFDATPSTKRIAVDRAVAGQNRTRTIAWRTPPLEEALRTALGDDIRRPLTEIATHLGYRSVTPLQNRYRDLCGEIVSKREVL
jgi:hypothetical protein